MLPQLVAFGAMGVACWYGSRWLRQEFQRVDSEMKRAERLLQGVRNSPLPQLRFDPMTGHYHPVE
jgi:hypothetical protein